MEDVDGIILVGAGERAGGCPVHKRAGEPVEEVVEDAVDEAVTGFRCPRIREAGRGRAGIPGSPPRCPRRVLRNRGGEKGRRNGGEGGADRWCCRTGCCRTGRCRTRLRRSSLRRIPVEHSPGQIGREGSIALRTGKRPLPTQGAEGERAAETGGFSVRLGASVSCSWSGRPSCPIRSVFGFRLRRGFPFRMGVPPSIRQVFSPRFIARSRSARSGSPPHRSPRPSPSPRTARTRSPPEG